MLKALIRATPAYPIARQAYRAIFKSGERLSVERMRAFYSFFFQPGEVVFDVGAEYSECFAREGANFFAFPTDASGPGGQAA